jgi:putative transposase
VAAEACRMSRPRPVFAGDVIHLQRRTRDGRFFLVPHPQTVELVQYAYAISAVRHGLVLHAVCIMSNHVHVIATDPHGRHPEFTQYAHRIIALGLKRMHDIEGPVWQEGGASVQRLVGTVALTEALAYVRINPVAAGLVRNEGIHPGVFGAAENAPLAVFTRHLTRPLCLGVESCLPKVATFECRPPDVLVDELGVMGAEAVIAEAIARHRDDAIEHRTAQKLGFLGLKRVLAADVWTRPTRPPKGAGFEPTFKGVAADAIHIARAALVAFRKAYAEAMAAFRLGVRDVIFPPGTYLMRRRMGCAVGAECS